jgi:S-adenosylmethionine:tRNA-ribosyltransferase-isomerase (queuine synthetase)
MDKIVLGAKMDINDFFYELPKELIAQEPIKERQMSRLLVLNKNTGAVEHHLNIPFFQSFLSDFL